MSGKLTSQNAQKGHTSSHNAFEAPPSTIAGVLINNISTTKPPQLYPQDDLQRVMSEVSVQENNIEGISDDERVEHKHKLIYVFARAVLERLSRDDPFINVQTLIGQGLEALDILTSTVVEVPSVLTYTLRTGSTFQSRGQEPLWLWLFPRLLTLLGRRNCEKLAERIETFFQAAFHNVARSPKLWDVGSLFFYYLKECINSRFLEALVSTQLTFEKALIGAIQAPSIIPQRRMAEVVLPLSGADLNVFSNSHVDTSDPAPLLPTYVARDPVESMHHIAKLSEIISYMILGADSCYIATLSFSDYLSWFIDSLKSLYVIQDKWKANLALYNSVRSLLPSILNLLNSLLTVLGDRLPGYVTRKGHVLLTVLCTDCLDDSTRLSDPILRDQLCLSLHDIAASCKDHVSLLRQVRLHLIPAVDRATAGEMTSYLQPGSDLEIATKVLKQSWQRVLELGPKFAHDIHRSEQSAPRKRYGTLDLAFNGAPEGVLVHPSKRRKIHAEPDVLGGIVRKLNSLLGSTVTPDLDGLSQAAVAHYINLDNEGQCAAVELLGLMPCAALGSLAVEHDEQGGIRKARCAVCDGFLPSANLNHEQCKSIIKEAVSTLANMIETPAFINSKRPRVLAMLTVRRFTSHFSDDCFVNLKTSQLGQWCLQSLKSSIRELRVAAGRTLPGFLRERDDGSRKNRYNVVGVLHSLSEQDTAHLQETCVLAWGQVGRVLENEELNAVLLKLVGYLGHSNPLVAGTAYNEILKLSKFGTGSKERSVERLLGPFWSSIAILAVKDLLVRPQTAQHVADLLEMTVSQFLILTQSHTLPWLVLWKQKDVIQRIVKARDDEEAWLTCMDPSNMASILTLLVVQAVPDVDTFVLSLLNGVSRRFQEQKLDLTDLLKFEPATTALHLLKAAGAAEKGKKSRVHLGLELLASRAQPTTEDNVQSSNAVEQFLEQHILGLVARVSEVVNNIREERHILEKRSSVKALEEMIILGKDSIRTARPQICALLQSALAQQSLEAAAFSAWACMLRYLNDGDVSIMLESTFSVMIQHWQSFDMETKLHAEDVLNYLLKDRPRIIRSKIVNLPSLSLLPELAAVEAKIADLRQATDVSNAFSIFSRRIGHENASVVAQVLHEMKYFLKEHQAYLQASAVSEQPDVVIGQLVRSILDACIKFNESHHDIACLSAECIGLIGCFDSNRVESIREQPEMVVVSNFEDGEETIDFVIFLLKEVIVKAFLSADTSVQGFLSYVMQELLDKIQFKAVCVPILRDGTKTHNSAVYKKWLSLPESVRMTLTPFLTSMYSLANLAKQETCYPIFPPDVSSSGKAYNKWLKTFVLDLLWKPSNVNATVIFAPLCRAIRIKDLSVASFLLPYVVLHNIVKGSDEDRQHISSELLAVLGHSTISNSKVKAEDAQFCIEAVFRILDYLSRWIQEKQLSCAQARIAPSPERELEVSRVEEMLKGIDAEIISQRAIECKSYSRALFSWEQHIRKLRILSNPRSETKLLEQLQEIYTQIDEPDGIEGISAHLHILDIDQQILGHRKAGRWTAAQTWYEIQLAEMPDNLDIQVNLLTCLKESGQHDVLLNYVEGMHTRPWTVSQLLPFATEASWATGRWLTLDKYTRLGPKNLGEDFNVGIGRSLLALYNKDSIAFEGTIRSLREQIAGSFSKATTSSLGAARNSMLKLHIVTELEMIAGTPNQDANSRGQILAILERRLEMIGGFLGDKQYLLGIRRAAMQISGVGFTKEDIASAWLTSARLARKGNAMHQSFNAVLHALKLGDESATIEQARLLWKDEGQDGNQRKAIQILQGAISSNAFIAHDRNLHDSELTGADRTQHQNLLIARAHLLLAKWLDSAGQTQTSALQKQYQKATHTYITWEKGHYYLGRHYNKILESEKILPAEHQTEDYFTGHYATYVIGEYLRALSYGTKYIYQTLPRILTLWLDLGMQVQSGSSEKYTTSCEAMAIIKTKRKKYLDEIHSKIQRYTGKLPAYIFYTALPQIVARITHPNPSVYQYLKQIIIKVVSTYPQHAMWSLLAMSTSMQSDRKAHGVEIIAALRDFKNSKSAAKSPDYKSLISHGSKLTEQLLMVCNNNDYHGNRTFKVKLKDIQFKPKQCTPNHLTVPIESVLTASLPTLTDNVKTHQAFSRDVVTIVDFEDDVLVLNSLAKPKKLTALGSDGRKYGLLCKPKDDLRKDQRLMEFNSMINRSLKRDAESSRRQLYIRTYSVTPLNEECGIIEWVDGLKTLRDILLVLYKARGISINYNEIAAYCEEALKGPEKLPWFTEKVIGQFPPVFHLWFVQQFPEPSAWFAARLRYTRSCAVMSMVGTILGLGDRHGENILFQEGNGGTFHVDFNCLFDKGLTFSKPERVPFRLTHNMVDAMGIYGYEGPFRKSSELTIRLLRQHEATLMTILEAFVYDPTLDLVKKADKRKKDGAGASKSPDTAQEVLDSVKRKLRGLLTGENVPLSVEGQVEELIKQATDPVFLAGMYIGWCNFL